MPLRPPNLLKKILTQGKAHLKLIHDEKVRPAVKDAVIKLLSCGTSLMGSRLFRCACCGDEKKQHFSCKGKFCNTCGKKSTDQWIETQREVLPDTEWQHITFTMPDVLWKVFMDNRDLHTHLFKLAAKGLLRKGKEKGI